MKDKNALWTDLLLRFAAQSECKSRQIGAIILVENRLVSQGWNSPPPHVSTDDCLRCQCKDKPHESGKNLDNAICIHAEQNAIMNAVYNGIALNGAEMWCTNKPCDICAAMICRSGIKTVIYLNDYPSQYADMFFAKSNIRAFSIEQYSKWSSQ